MGKAFWLLYSKIIFKWITFNNDDDDDDKEEKEEEEEAVEEEEVEEVVVLTGIPAISQIL